MNLASLRGMTNSFLDNTTYKTVVSIHLYPLSMTYNA